MKVSHYKTGGFVAHGMTGYWKGRVSGYFNADGVMVDAEQITAKGVRPIPYNGPMWNRLAEAGRVYTANKRASSSV